MSLKLIGSDPGLALILVLILLVLVLLLNLLTLTNALFNPLKINPD